MVLAKITEDWKQTNKSNTCCWSHNYSAYRNVLFFVQEEIDPALQTLEERQTSMGSSHHMELMPGVGQYFSPTARVIVQPVTLEGNDETLGELEGYESRNLSRRASANDVNVEFDSEGNEANSENEVQRRLRLMPAMQKWKDTTRHKIDYCALYYNILGTSRRICARLSLQREKATS